MLYICHTWTKWIYYFDYTNVANKNCDEFCMKEVFKCRGRRMMWWDELWTKAQAWGCPFHPKKYSRGTSVEAWGCPEASPFLSPKYQVLSQCASLFIASYNMCYSWSVFIFVFSFILFCFVLSNKWLDPIIIVLERDTLRFNCIEHSSFHSHCSTSVLFLLLLRLALVFH